MTHLLRRALVHERIHHIHTQVDYVSCQALKLHLLVVSSLSRGNWTDIERILMVWVEMVKKRITCKQTVIFERLSGKKKEKVGIVTRTVVNLSSKDLDEVTESILVKGLNFAIAPRTLPVKEIISAVEVAIKDLSLAEAEEIRRELCKILKKRRSMRYHH